MLIFEHSRSGRTNPSHFPEGEMAPIDLPERFRRSIPPALPEVSELQVVRHYTRLSQRNFSVDTHFYPLGSCTMKYNPRICHRLAMLPGFLAGHPLDPEEIGQGLLITLHELQEMLAEITGMTRISLVPMAGAQGELAGVLMIRAYHQSRGDLERVEMLVPSAAHGTNPATVTMAGLVVREIPVNDQGDVDITALAATVGPRTAGLMMTNPSTLGVFERQVAEIAAIVHGAGGLLYYDGANLNAIAGRVRPGDMGFDCVHLNLHKTFATPHGAGGPGAGPVGVRPALLPFLPLPMVALTDAGAYHWLTEADCPQSIGRMGAFAGNVGVLLRAYVYLRLLGAEGCRRIATGAVLNANYLMEQLREAGFRVAYPKRRASHEFVVSLRPEAEAYGITALDLAKRLLDYGVHAPTIYFPQLVPEALLIEPTETESREDLDRFVAAMVAIRRECQENPGLVKGAPHTMFRRRLDETVAARQPDLAWQMQK